MLIHARFLMYFSLSQAISRILSLESEPCIRNQWIERMQSEWEGRKEGKRRSAAGAELSSPILGLSTSIYPSVAKDSVHERELHLYRRVLEGHSESCAPERAFFRLETGRVTRHLSFRRLQASVEETDTLFSRDRFLTCSTIRFRLIEQCKRAGQSCRGGK